MTPSEAFDHALQWCMLRDGFLRGPKHNVPGEVIQRLGADKRAALAGLTSDMACVRAPRFVKYYVEPPHDLSYHYADLPRLDQQLIAGARHRAIAEKV